MPTVAEVIVARLAAAGVGTLFGVPGGGSNLDLVEAARRAGLPFVLTATENGAAIAAQAQAELTGGLGACLTTLGPGAASATNGVACALLERAPIAVFTDSPGLDAHGAFQHQQIDHRTLMRGITKRSDRLTAQSAAHTIDAAIETALSGPPGPVHLDCPGKVLGLESVGSQRRPHRRSSPGAKGVRSLPNRLSQTIRRARRPILLVGLGARRPGDAPAIDRLCRAYGLPALVTYKAKGVVPDTHPWFAGVFTNAAIERAVVGEADLILTLGLDPVELMPRPWPYRAPVISGCPWPIAADHVPFVHRATTDVATFVKVLETNLSRSTWDAERIRAGFVDQQSAIDLPAGGLTAQQVVRITAAELASTHRLTIDAGAHMLPATMLWPVAQPNGLLISNGLSTMGYAVPAAIGAALTDRRTPVVAFTGDGGLLMCAGELLTVVRERLPVIVVVFNDASLSLIEIKQQVRRLPPAGVGIGHVDWRLLGSSLGLKGFLATTEGELRTAVRQARDTGAPALVDARIDRSNYVATLRAIRGS